MTIIDGRCTWHDQFDSRSRANIQLSTAISALTDLSVRFVWFHDWGSFLLKSVIEYNQGLQRIQVPFFSQQKYIQIKKMTKNIPIFLTENETLENNIHGENILLPQHNSNL